MALKPKSSQSSALGPPVSQTDFELLMEPFGPFPDGETMAVAVSGGPDSMALCRLVQVWSDNKGIKLIGLTVDHGLRPDAAQEAGQVSQWLKHRGMSHQTLVWEEGKTVGQLERSPQAAARDARFELMCRWCRDNGVLRLLIAHHADDQAETFLHRLVRGSGVDGLAAMAPETVRHGITLLRPLLRRFKADLIATCKAFDQPWIDDPSNDDDRYTRVRLRKLLSALEKEGFNTDRLLNTVTHMQRAKAAIDSAVTNVMRDAVRQTEPEALAVDYAVLKAAPEEVGLRCLARCLCQLSGAAYPPRFESLAHVYGALGTAEWSDRTLHGCQLRVTDGTLLVTPEAQERQNPG